MNTDLITQITEDQVQTLKALESLNINRNFIHANIEDTEDENQFVKECDLHQTFINIPCDENVIDLTQICRFCLAKRDHMQYIFNEDSGLSEAVMTISNVQLQPNDGLPTQMCSHCLTQLTKALSFKRQIESTDEYLRHYCTNGFTNDTVIQPIEIPEDFLYSNYGTENNPKSFTLNLIKSQSECEDGIESVERIGENLVITTENSQSDLTNILELENDELGQIVETNQFNKNEVNIIDATTVKNEFLESNSDQAIEAEKGTNLNIQDVNDTSDKADVIPELNEINFSSAVVELDEEHDDFQNIVEEHLQSDENIDISCSSCFKEFPTQKSLEKHEKKCTVIAKKKMKSSKLKTSKSQMEEPPDPNYHFMCKICNQGFHIESDLLLHLSIHSNDGKNTCSECMKQFSTSFQLKRHIRIHFTDKPHKCSICKKGFPEMASLTRHFRRHTGEQREKKHVCRVCGKKYYDSHSLNIHMRLHTGERPWVCSVCEKSFIDSRLLNSHMKVHSTNRPHTCEICKKSFTHQSTLRTHIRTHTGEKPYICSVCGKSFIQSSNLSLHMRVHSGEKPYACTRCNRSFASSSTLTTHMRTHTGEKPYSCKTCGKAFARQDLTAHMRIHTGEKPYTCQYCNKKFTTSGHLSQHIRTHSGTKQFTCTICPKRCSSLTYMKKHIRTHHPSESKSDDNVEEENEDQLHCSASDVENDADEIENSLENHNENCDNDVSNDLSTIHEIDNSILSFHTSDMLNVVNDTTGGSSLLSNVSIQVPVLTNDGLLTTSTGTLYSTLDGKYIYQAIDPSIMRIEQVHSGAQIIDNNGDIIR